MPTREDLKSKVRQAIDARKKWVIDTSEAILDTPEPGFQELKTSRLVSEKLAELGVPHQKGIAITGIKGLLKGASPGPTVAVIGELDSLRVPEHVKADLTTGAAHACGHHAQIGMMLGVAAGLLTCGVLESLSGNVALIAVPAEEFIDVEYRWGLRQEGKLGLMSGKQEFIRLGAFDDVDVAMMVHTSSNREDREFSLGGTSNGHVVKLVQYVGEPAHAASAPHLGVNALQAAMLGINAINTQRETFRDRDVVRVHGIMTRGGASVNSIPADVRFEGRVRGRTASAIEDVNEKVDRCLKAGALAMGASVKIVTIPGYLPMINDPALGDLFKGNAVSLVGEDHVSEYHPKRMRGGSTDMGDLSHLIPAIHPYVGGATGAGHGRDYLIDDYDTAVINPAMAMAMTVIDLLSDGASRASEVLSRSKPTMTREQYLSFQENRLKEVTYEGR